MFDLTTAVHHYLTTALSSNYLHQQVRVGEAWVGGENLLWRVQSEHDDVVVKLFRDAGQARSRRQYDAQRHFAAEGIAPHPVWHDRYPEGLPYQVLVYNWAAGDAPAVGDHQAMHALARAVAQVHATDTVYVRRVSPHPYNMEIFGRILQGSLLQTQHWLAEQKIDQLTARFTSIAEAATQLVQRSLPLWRSATPTPVHGDLALDNAVIAGAHVTLLDWEMFGLGDPALDVARLLASAPQSAAAPWRSSWLESYLSYFDQPDLSARIAALTALLPAEALCYLLNGWRSFQARPENSATVIAATPGIEQSDVAELTSIIANAFALAADQLGATEVGVEDEVATLLAR